MRALTPHCVTPREATAAIPVLPDRSVVVFGCYLPEWEPLVRLAKDLGHRTVLTWYASYPLNEFDGRNRRWMQAALRLAEQGLFDFIATPHDGLASTWTFYGYLTDVLPPTIDVDFAVVEKQSGVHLGIFGSAMPWKNMDCQIAAAGMVPDAVIHVQGGHAPHKIPLVRHPHLDTDADYYQLVGSMRINLCISLSEVFSFLVAESLLMGTPVATGVVTPILKYAPHELQRCRVAHFDDPMAIAGTLYWILNNYDQVAGIGRWYMRSLNDRNRVIADHVKEKWLNG